MTTENTENKTTPKICNITVAAVLSTIESANQHIAGDILLTY